MFDRNTIIALIIIGLILLLLPEYYKLVSPQRPAAPQPTNGTPVQRPADSASAAAKDTVKPAVPGESRLTVASAAPVSDTTAVILDFVEIESPLYKMTIASNGHVTSYILKNYRTHEKEHVSLTQPTGNNLQASGIIEFDFGGHSFRDFSNIRFTASKRRIELTSGTDSVTFHYSDSLQRMIGVTYIFYADKYGFVITLASGGWQTPETGEFAIVRRGGMPSTEANAGSDLQYAGAYARIGGEIEKIEVAGKAHREFQATGKTDFVAVRSKYFIAAIIPDVPASGVYMSGLNRAPKDKASPHYYEVALRHSWGKSAEGRWTVYWGPMKYEYLKELGAGVEETMNWGWKIIKPFSKLVLWSLTRLHSAIPNYGLVIIVFSVIVKVVLWPLTRKSQVSMKKMAALQPEIKALRELHSKNPQALNQAIMKLYKERGVNPASGCIPILLQMPLLYALFVIFSTTIEFRQSPFILWITDLSQPDVIFRLPFSIPLYGSGVAILPIAMGITQFFMSKRTTTDPSQKMMIYIMPIFMVLIFNNLPSGLSLYYTLFNVLAIVEQNLIKLPDFTPSVEVVEEKKKGKRSVGSLPRS